MLIVMSQLEHPPCDRSLIIQKAARVAYLVSDTILSVQPSLQTDSLFSKPLKALKASNARSILPGSAPEVSKLATCPVMEISQDQD
jgi:sulfite reductase (NADPH) hemoprotein beta-component